MNLRSPRRREEPEINLIPMIDVVLVVLIFFVIATSFRKEADLKIELPEASQRPLPAEQERLEVAIDAQGRYRVNDMALADTAINTLKTALSEVAGDRRDLSFVIRADGRTPHQAVVTVMDAAGQLGFKRLAIVTIQGAGRNEPVPAGR